MADGSGPTNLYGYFASPASFVNTGKNDVAVQGVNVAKMLTPQSQQGFDVVVDSATLVAILQKINQGEVLSNACHNATTSTRWRTTVSEFAKSDSGAITLNFFPTSSTPNVYDAWTHNSCAAFRLTATTRASRLPATHPARSL